MSASPEYVERRLAERGLPTGGTTGQVLAKTTDNNYETGWTSADLVIPDGSITTAKLADESVTSAKIALGAIVNLDVATNAGILVTKLAAGTAGQILQSNATPVPAWTTVTGDVTISSTGVTTIANDAVTAAKIAQGTAGQLLISNATPDTAWTTLSGDATLSGSGALTIASNAVTTGKINTGAVTTAKLSTTTGEIAGAWNADTTTGGFTNVTGGNLTRRWLVVGKTLYFRMWFTAGTATAIGTVDVTLPGGLSVPTTRVQFYNGANGASLVSAYTPTGSSTIVRFTNSTAAATFAAGATLVNLSVNGVAELA